MTRRFAPDELTGRYRAAELATHPTLREWYAGLALSAIAGRPDAPESNEIAAFAVRLADLTIAELARTDHFRPDPDYVPPSPMGRAE